MRQEPEKRSPKKPQKVLFLITKANWGGAQRYVYDLATNLPKGQFEVAVAYGLPGKLSEVLAAHDVRLIPVMDLGRDVDLLSDFRALFQIFSLLRKERPDVVHLNSSKAAALGAVAARLARIARIIFTVHGWPFKENRGSFSSSMIRAVSWLTAILSTAVITVSKEDEYIGTSMRGIATKVRYIPIGINIPEFVPRDMASLILPPSMQTDSDWPRLVTIAELTANKGLSYAIEAILLLKELETNVSYTIIGEGEERERLAAQAQSLGISDRVHFLGFIPDAARYLKAFDLFILPSIKEGMPYVLLEAGMAQLPIISTSVVDPMFFELSPTAIPVKPADPQALADAILKILHTKTLLPQPPISSFSDMINQTIEAYTTAPTISVSSRA
jgi:glycosyltransferase involved in cell wall biosynthesis